MKPQRLITRGIPTILMAGMMLCASACGNSDKGRNNAMALQLFSKSVNLIKGYTDSIRQTNDSASLRRLSNEFNERIAKVNFEFPADTDLDLTEQENDSLIKMIDKLVELIRQKEKTLNISVTYDSIPTTDSLGNRTFIVPYRPVKQPDPVRHSYAPEDSKEKPQPASEQKEKVEKTNDHATETTQQKADSI